MSIAVYVGMQRDREIKVTTGASMGYCETSTRHVKLLKTRNIPATPDH